MIVAFDGAQGLDVMGPAEVFAGAGRLAGTLPYDVVVAAVDGGTIRVTSGIRLKVRDLMRLRPRPTDTVLVVGGEQESVRRATVDHRLIRWVRRAAAVVKRIGSVCSGAFVLARAGVLEGRRAATHWSACDLLARTHPQVQVDPNAIFVQDGKVWTSAGVTTGIDMSLAIIEEEHGAGAADTIAARFVLYLRRPGFQSQFSEALVAQCEASEPLAAVVAWARTNLRTGLDAAKLARRAGMSLRTFHRRCAEQLGTTPAKLIETLRVEQARTLLSSTSLGTKVVAARAGFGSPGRMARAFRRTLGVAPSAYAVLHARGA